MTQDVGNEKVKLEVNMCDNSRNQQINVDMIKLSYV